MAGPSVIPSAIEEEDPTIDDATPELARRYKELFRHDLEQDVFGPKMLQERAIANEAKIKGMIEKPYADRGLGADLVRSTIGGVRDAVAHTAAAADDLIDWIADMTGTEKGGLFETISSIPEVSEPHTMTGGITRSLAQFITGFIPASKVLKGMGVTSQLVRSSGGGAIADFLAFDPDDPTVGNMINDLAPAIKNPLTDFLATDPDDSEALNRFKRAIEGLGLGALADGLVRTAKLMHQVRRTKKVERAFEEAKSSSAIQALDDATAESLGKSLTKAVTDVGTEIDPAKMTPAERVALEQLRDGFEIAQRKGFDTGEVTRAAFEGVPGDVRLKLQADLGIIPQGFTRDALQDALNITPEEAEGLVVLAESMGIDLNRVFLTKGGVPGDDALFQLADIKQEFRDILGPQLSRYFGTHTDPERISKWDVGIVRRLRERVAQFQNVKDLVNLARMGAQGRKWYQLANRVIKAAAGDEDWILAGALAAASPNKDVSASVGIALNSIKAWKAELAARAAKSGKKVAVASQSTAGKPASKVTNLSDRVKTTARDAGVEHRQQGGRRADIPATVQAAARRYPKLGVILEYHAGYTEGVPRLKLDAIDAMLEQIEPTPMTEDELVDLLWQWRNADGTPTGKGPRGRITSGQGVWQDKTRAIYLGADLPNMVAVFRGTDFETALAGMSATSPKVRPFYQALMGDLTAVVSDTHHARAIGSLPGKIGDAVPGTVSDMLTRQVASELGWEPAEAQAGMWAVIRVLVKRLKKKGATTESVIAEPITFEELMPGDDIATLLTQGATNADYPAILGAIGYDAFSARRVGRRAGAALVERGDGDVSLGTLGKAGGSRFVRKLRRLLDTEAAEKAGAAARKEARATDTLGQGDKASVEFLDQGIALIRGLKNPDVSSGIHELAHVARRQFFDKNLPPVDRLGITDADIDIAVSWAGATDGWTREAEEKFARGFERFLRDGTAPIPALAATFKKLRDWLTRIYVRIDGSDIDVNISPEMNEVFAKLPGRRRLRRRRPVWPVGRGAYHPRSSSDIFKRFEQQAAGDAAGTRAVDAFSDTARDAGRILGKDEPIRDTMDELAEMGNTYAEEVQRARQGRRPRATAEREAAELGTTVDDIREIMPGTAMNDTEALAMVRVLKESGEKLRGLAEAVKAGDKKAEDAFLRQMYVHGQIDPKRLGVLAEAGRTLGVLNQPASGINQFLDQFTEVLVKSAGRGLSVERLAHMVGELRTPQQLKNFTKELTRPGFSEFFFEYWINALLSGVHTQAINVLGNSMMMLWAIPERAIAARLSKSGIEGVQTGEARALIFGLINCFKDAFTLAARAFRTGIPSSSTTKVELLRYQPAITGENVLGAFPRLERGLDHINATGGVGKAIDLIGTYVIRWPGRSLMTADEFFKAMNYRMELSAQAFRQASKEGLDSEGMARRIREILVNPPEFIEQLARDAADYRTFTKELGQTGQMIQAFANSHPLRKLILPFVRTPLDISKVAFEHMPLIRRISREVRADIEAGGARADLARARAATGSAIMAMTSYLTMTGVISGRGPADPTVRERMRREGGWKPYAGQIDGTWYAYDRLDPVGMMIGVAADMTDMSGQMDPVTFNKLMGAFVLAVSQNITNKTYMRGVSDFIEATSGEFYDRPATTGGRLDRYVNRFIASLVPSIVAQGARLLDPGMKEIDGAIDAILQRTPGARGLVPNQLNLWGDEIFLGGGLGPDLISPIYTSQESKDPVNAAIRDNQMSITMPTRQISGVRMTREEYQTFVKMAGEPAKKKLDSLVKGPFFQALTDGPGGGKEFAVKDVIQTFRTLARQRVLFDANLTAEFAELRGMVAEKDKKRTEALTGLKVSP